MYISHLVGKSSNGCEIQHHKVRYGRFPIGPIRAIWAYSKTFLLYKYIEIFTWIYRWLDFFCQLSPTLILNSIWVFFWNSWSLIMKVTLLHKLWRKDFSIFDPFRVDKRKHLVTPRVYEDIRRKLFMTCIDNQTKILFFK